MGGSGSGSTYHWWRSSKKRTVDESLQLDANRWMREGILKEGICKAGSWTWTYRDGRQNSVNYAIVTRDTDCPTVCLSYTSTRSDGVKESLDYDVRLTTTPPRFGGLRWWFICPLVVNGRPCCRRVGKLHLPPGGRHFGCRHCHELTYTSCQEHDKRVDALRKNPELLRRMMENPDLPLDTQLILALKAMRF